MRIIEETIVLEELKVMAKERFGNLVKAVVDIERGIMAVDGELHADEEAMLLEKGSKQENLWGINIYPEMSGEDMVEFDSMINVRPTQENYSRGVESEEIRRKIIEVVNKLLKE